MIFITAGRDVMEKKGGRAGVRQGEEMERMEKE